MRRRLPAPFKQIDAMLEGLEWIDRIVFIVVAVFVTLFVLGSILPNLPSH